MWTWCLRLFTQETSFAYCHLPVTRVTVLIIALWFLSGFFSSLAREFYAHRVKWWMCVLKSYCVSVARRMQLWSRQFRIDLWGNWKTDEPDSPQLDIVRARFWDCRIVIKIVSFWVGSTFCLLCTGLGNARGIRAAGSWVIIVEM